MPSQATKYFSAPALRNLQTDPLPQLCSSDTKFRETVAETVIGVVIVKSFIHIAA
jgi:hypothetical protein